ncbi:FAD-dependent oxidoreductase [soil metagenome]|jgi:NADH dehydrogenase FAD-containing subunit
MMLRNDDKPTIIFAGGGHAHLYSLLRTDQMVQKGYDVVLINPSPYLYYSGMATGVISGLYTPEEDRIDVRYLVEAGGGRFVKSRVTGVLPKDRELLLDGGERLSYDVVSFCLGSGVDSRIDSANEDGIPVKPVENTAEIRARIINEDPDVLVVGGGAAGCEVAANASSLILQRGGKGRVTLAEGGPTLLDSSPEKARRGMLDHLEGRGVEVLLNTRVVSHADGKATTLDGREILAGLLVPATGIVPHSIFRNPQLSLLTGADSGLWVDHHLRSVSDRRLFGGGDSISFRGGILPRLGVFATRQGPILFHNLNATLRGETLRTYEPQNRFLYILELGDDTGLAIYGPLVCKGRAAARLKHLIDKRFMEQYRIA